MKLIRLIMQFIINTQFINDLTSNFGNIEETTYLWRWYSLWFQSWRYLNSANRKKKIGDDSPPNRRLNCTKSCYNWPPPNPQSTYYCQGILGFTTLFSQENGWWNHGMIFHLPHRLLNRENIGRGTHAHTPCVNMQLLFLYFKFNLI